MLATALLQLLLGGLALQPFIIAATRRISCTLQLRASPSVGVEPDQEDSNGRIALMIAAEYGNIKVVEALLADRADLAVNEMNGRKVADGGHVPCADVAVHGCRRGGIAAPRVQKYPS